MDEGTGDVRHFAHVPGAYAAGELDDADVAVDYVVSLLRIGQNGQSPAA